MPEERKEQLMEVKQEGPCDKRGHGVKHSLQWPHRHSGNCKAAELWGGTGEV